MPLVYKNTYKIEMLLKVPDIMLLIKFQSSFYDKTLFYD